MSEQILAKVLQPAPNRWKFLLSELRPKGKLLTPFNIISIPVILLGLVLIIIRFWKGLGSITNLSQDVPWGLWIGFDVVTGVAFAGGAYVLTFMVYILRMEKYHSIVRATVLNGFLAYLFYAGALLLDLGRPWNVINPIIGNSFGTSSVLFLVAWHFMLYMLAELIEFSPAIAEWLGAERARRILKSLTIGAVIFGITLSTLHQSGLGALFLMAKGKIHPLWYSEFIPVLFFVSSIFAGLSMVIFEGSITQRVFAHQLSRGSHKTHNEILRGLAKICSVAMFAYLFLKIIDLIHGHNLSHLSTSWGAWYLVEMVGFVILPLFLFIRGVKTGGPFIIKAASFITLIGIILNRLNISVIGFNWDAVDRYIPTWMEFEVTFAVLFLEIWIFRWVLHRLPVLRPIEEVVKSQTIDRS
ncbi:Ni/Fe-hydrogenase cytochrome b subunit [bacterium]|nr:Ni/Fe-hydrogenase cytochrome b subunit [bacterium]